MRSAQHEQCLVWLAKILIAFSGDGTCCISVVKLFNRSSLPWIKHHVDHVLNILKSLTLKVKHNFTDELFFSPDEQNSIFHHTRRNVKVFESCYWDSTVGFTTLVFLGFLLFFNTIHFLTMLGPIRVDENSLNPCELLNLIFCELVFISPVKVNHSCNILDTREHLELFFQVNFSNLRSHGLLWFNLLRRNTLFTIVIWCVFARLREEIANVCLLCVLLSWRSLLELLVTEFLLLFFFNPGHNNFENALIIIKLPWMKSFVTPQRLGMFLGLPFLSARNCWTSMLCFKKAIQSGLALDACSILILTITFLSRVW